MAPALTPCCRRFAQMLSEQGQRLLRGMFTAYLCCVACRTCLHHTPISCPPCRTCNRILRPPTNAYKNFIACALRTGSTKEDRMRANTRQGGRQRSAGLLASGTQEAPDCPVASSADEANATCRRYASSTIAQRWVSAARMYTRHALGLLSHATTFASSRAYAMYSCTGARWSDNLVLCVCGHACVHDLPKMRILAGRRTSSWRPGGYTCGHCAQIRRTVGRS